MGPADRKVLSLLIWSETKNEGQREEGRTEGRRGKNPPLPPPEVVRGRIVPRARISVATQRG